MNFGLFLFAILPFPACAFFTAPAVTQSRVGSTVLRAVHEVHDVSTRQQHLSSTFQSLVLAGLGTTAGIALSTAPANAATKVEYLKEPTPEFEEMQKRAMAFERAALEKKKVWKDKYAVLPQAKTEQELVAALDGLTKFVLEERGLPVGIKMQTLVSDIRKVKRAGKDAKIWNKEAEISYEKLIYAINYQQSPNTSRDLTNPL